ncbi:LamB/YcsF family protein [Alkaliphilus metalliredigens QYMF]|uniref:5-oxoprolinase subunit A n=1 Tax=Alkaliphilus metalliredigens (strain QYMF) TaxID=293826 RepID=PXPA_ALKMQ|nr:5-oxoprolinase subunit PxpA [Alkaliphilus metalliredigens]A6TSF8.1 RecName: Full=5-oxoprolinase subunit A; Short=5-OPase subunit A; AltName: Full=5-oxoprolinase (ATP-hydrolyzing) subunit A [Alkaliphilus metalliredigens QYMF]ABR49126.1 LamB/YcsF family protein [Alkaliphilus metalliredigens QYMF]
MYQVDLNSDIGESFGAYELGMDGEVVKYITSANIACGWHAGDPMVMEKTVQAAIRNKVAIGAHPGFPDLMGFGRRNMVVTQEEAKAYVKYQIGALWAFTKAAGVAIQHVKPHGALYNMAAKDEGLAKAIAEAVYEIDPNIILVGLANSKMTEVGEKLGLKVAHEVFADRAYNSDGTLVSRNTKGAVIHDSDLAVARVVRMIKKGKVEAINGEDVSIKAHSICVHGDNEHALEFVNKIRETLGKEEIQVISMDALLK